jgi:hypothetical protein
MHQRRQTPAELPAAHTAARVTANDGDALTALRIAARWCITAAELVSAEEHTAPPLSPVRRAIVAALARTDRASLDALSLALARWCEAASGSPDANDLAGLILAAVNAAGACTMAETPDAPITGDPLAG